MNINAKQDFFTRHFDKFFLVGLISIPASTVIRLIFNI